MNTDTKKDGGQKLPDAPGPIVAVREAHTYKIVYDEPSSDMQPLFDMLTSSGWNLHSVVPGYSHERSCYPTQFIFQREPSLRPLFILWALLLVGALLTAASLAAR